MYILKIFKYFIKDYKFTVILYIIFTILAFPLESIVVPQIYSNFFEVLTTKTQTSVFLKYFIYIVLLLSVVNISNCTTTYIESFMIPELNGFIINYIFKNLLKKYENSITDIELGKIITRLSIIPQHLKEFITEFCIWIFPRFLTIILINIYFIFLNFKLGIFSTIILIIFLYFNLKYFISCAPISTERHLLFEGKNEDTQDRLANSLSIYSNGYLNKEIDSYENHTKAYTSKFKENLWCLTKSTIFSSAGTMFIFIALNSYAVYLFIKKQLSFTNLMAIFITIIYYIPCIITINSTLPTLIHYYGSLSSIDSFIEDLYKVDINYVNVKKEDNEIIMKINKGNIVINNLNFSYVKDNYLFNKFYLTIKEQEKIAILGPSGNGKSTLIKLIMGYYKLDNGSIYIDDKDINEYNLNDLRKQISYVNQNSKLFNTSLLKNIQYGNNYTDNEIIELCNKLKVDNVFKNLKEGLNTNVGVEGSKLSGGQRQLVHILRCICKKNKIVILDEPTSAIDKENKQNIIDAIKELSKSSTLIIITHDDTLLELVNRVIKMDSGKIVEDEYIRK
jgi:ABC-type multidrug transport system fused ATPase/permease subunit